MDLGAQVASVEMLSYGSRAVRCEEPLREVGDLRDIGMLRPVCRRRHARPPPPFTAAGSFGPVSGGTACRGSAEDGTGGPRVQLRAPTCLVPSPVASGCRWVSNGCRLALPRAQRIVTVPPGTPRLRV